MRTPDERIEELIAAAAADSLAPREADELARLTHEHPWIPEEIEALRDTSARLTNAGATWTDVVITEALRERILGGLPVRTRPAQHRRRLWIAPLVGAASLAIGLAIGAVLPALYSTQPDGPPGTLGAYEPVVVAETRGIDVEADLVAHTWGTEAVLDVSGLTPGATYSIVFIGDGGDEFSAGEMLGSTITIHCRLNAAVLREQAARLEIRDESATIVASADLPRV